MGNGSTFRKSKVYALDGVNYTTIAAVITACSAAAGRAIAWIPDNSNPTLSTVLTISGACHVIFGKNTITCTMADPGITSGCFFVASDNVEIEGQGPSTVMTQPNAANIQTAIFLGAGGNIKIHRMKFDWNDANQTNAAGYYSVIRSAAGSHDIRIWSSEFTRGGDRAIDLRGTKRSWITHNWFHQTGIRTAGRANGGNSVSVDVDGTTRSTDCWLEDNLVEEQGDSFACANALRVHITRNTIRGRADVGNTPTAVEAGLDATGDVDAEIVGNHVINSRGPQLSVQSDRVAGVEYFTRNVRIANNVFVATAACCGLAATDPRVVVGSIAGTGVTAGQQKNIRFIHNSLTGVRLSSHTVDNLQIKGNTFHNILSSLSSIAINLDQVNGTGAAMKTFVVSGNTFTTDNATLVTAFKLGGSINTREGYVHVDTSSCTGAVSCNGVLHAKQ
jgi:hypothetical protein